MSKLFCRVCVGEIAKDENQEREKIHCVVSRSLIKTCISCFRCINMLFKFYERRKEMKC